jgi:type I restriction enzyme M protein
MNLAVHGLEGNIIEGNTFYEDKHNMLGKADFVMSNPPFNVDEVDAEKVKNDPRLPFGLPGVNKNNKVSNGNYLWISYFYSYLNDKGRAGFVMSSQASAAGHGERDVRKRIVETGHVDVMISIRSNFFYTRTVPCELWFFDKNKLKTMRDKVLMLDARNIFRKVTRKVYDFSPEQLKNISAIIWLYRGKTDSYLKLISAYFSSVCSECKLIPEKITSFEKSLEIISSAVNKFSSSVEKSKDVDTAKKKELSEGIIEWDTSYKDYKKDCKSLLSEIEKYTSSVCKKIPTKNSEQIKARESFDAHSESIKGLIKQIDMLYKLAIRAIDISEKELSARDNEAYDFRLVNKSKKELDELRKDTVEQLKLAGYFHKQIHWLQSRFPDAKLCDVEGLLKLVDIKEIEKNDYALTPGRYVGVAPAEVDDNEDFEEQLRDIHVELASLNEEAIELAKKIADNFEELGI